MSSIDLRQGRVDALPWNSNSIDKILAVNVLYFFASDGAEIAEARRVLRRGGKMVLYATDRSSMQKWKMCTAETHRMFDANELRELLRRGGFADDEIKIEQIRLSFGIRGLLAEVRKTPRCAKPIRHRAQYGHLQPPAVLLAASHRSPETSASPHQHWKLYR